MGLPELKSIRKFGLGRRGIKEPEKRLWKCPAESSTSSTGRLGAPPPPPDQQQRDPAAIRAYTTPNICVQGGRIEFIQTPTLEKRADRYLSTSGGSRHNSSLVSPASSVTKLGRDMTLNSQARQDCQSVPPTTSGVKTTRDVTLPSRDKRDVTERDVSSLREWRPGSVTSPRSGRRAVTTNHVTRPGATPPRREKPAQTEAELSPARETSGEANTSGNAHKGTTSRHSTLVAKEKKEEDNQERRNTRPPAAQGAAVRDTMSPLRSPTPVRRLSKVRAKVAQFEQLGGAKEASPSVVAASVTAATAPAADEATSSQSHLEEELSSLERGLEEECLNFRRWSRMAQRSVGEHRGRQNRQLVNMSVGSDRCRDRIFSMQDELQRSEDRLKAAELARSEADKKLTAMDSLMKAHESERQHWLSQVHQLTGQLERMKTSSPSDEASAPSRADLQVKIRSLESQRQEQEKRSDKCLDELANQIVQALSKQKSLQNGVARLRRRIHELEHENAVLYSLLGRDAGAPPPLPSPVLPQTPSGAAEEEAMTAVCAKVRRILEEHYSLPADRRAASASSGPLRWSQFVALLAEDVSSTGLDSCPLCASLQCDRNCRLYAPESWGTRTAAPHVAAKESCSASELRQVAGSDVMRRLCEAADSACAAQRNLRSLGTQQCSKARSYGLTISTALTDAEKCATLAALPVKLGEVPRVPAVPAEHISPLPKPSPDLSVRASSCPPSRDDSKREEGRDEGYSTMSSDVQANVSADSGVSISSSAEVPQESRPRLEDVREVQEEGSAGPEMVERPASVSSSDSEDLRSLVQALRQSLRPGRRLRADRVAFGDTCVTAGSAAHARYSCVLPARPRPVHRCRSDSRLCVKRWAETSASAAAVPTAWDSRAPERSSSTLELGAGSTLDTRRSSSLKRAAAEESLERPPPSPTPAPMAFIPAALPWRDDSSELWRNCFSLESARDMEDWSLSADELRSELTDESHGGGGLVGDFKQADSSDYSRVGSFSNIQESILELEEDVSECLWNNASYMNSHSQPPAATLPAWPYELPPASHARHEYHPLSLLSPVSGGVRSSWSSSERLSFADITVLDFNDKNDVKSTLDADGKAVTLPRPHDPKRLSDGSDAMSCTSVVSEDGDNNLETDFTRDFYRLVKYESSKSLALSETSMRGDDETEATSAADREMALSSMLDFISEQQRYIEQRESQDQCYIDLPVSGVSESVGADPATDSSSESPSTIALDRSTSSATSVVAVDFSGAAVLEPAQRGTLDSSISLSQLTGGQEKVSSVVCTEDRCDTVSSAGSGAQSPPPVIVYRAEISTNHKAYTPPKDEGKFTGDSGSHASQSEPKEIAVTVNPAKVSSKSGIPRSPLVGKRKRTAAAAAIGNASSRARPPSSPKLTSKLKRDSIRPLPEPVVEASSPQPVAKTSLPSPKLLRRLCHPHRSTEKSNSSTSDPSSSRSNYHRSDSAPGQRPESPLRRVTTASATTPGSGIPRSAPSARPVGSRIPRLRGSRSSDSRVETTGSAAAGRATELVRAISEPAEIAEACSRGSPLIVRHGDVTSFHRRATSRQLIDELQRLSRLEAEEAGAEGEEEERTPRTEGSDTGWVRVDQHVNTRAGKAGTAMYDVMLAAHASGSSSDSDDDVIAQPTSEYQHLKWVHQARRRKQVSRRVDGALRYTPVFRPPIHNRPEFFFRYGPQEQAALATFDFLDRLPSSSTGDVTSASVTSHR